MDDHHHCAAALGLGCSAGFSEGGETEWEGEGEAARNIEWQTRKLRRMTFA
jgi:hypothetical protein